MRGVTGKERAGSGIWPLWRFGASCGLPAWCYTYPPTTRKDDILMLKDAGLSSSPWACSRAAWEVLKEYNRPVPLQMAIEAAKILVECGVPAFFDLISRYPSLIDRFLPEQLSSFFLSITTTRAGSGTWSTSAMRRACGPIARPPHGLSGAAACAIGAMALRRVRRPGR